MPIAEKNKIDSPVMALSEFDLIQRYFVSRAKSSSDVSLGAGDDCALLRVPDNRVLVVSTDSMIAGVHFPENTLGEHVASRALGAAISDLAAMGAKPAWFTLALTLPEVEEAWLSSFSQGLFETAEGVDCTLVGGDTSRGPMNIGVHVMGLSAPDRALTRSGARVNDLVCVSGCLGDAAAGLALAQNKLKTSADCARYLLDRFYRPRARIALGQALQGLATSALDISDGLVADLGHICRASGVAATIDIEALPLSSELLSCCALNLAQRWALTGGDDYELCFTVAPSRFAELKRLSIEVGIDITPIGNIVAGVGVTVVQQGHPYLLESVGYEHFRS